MTRLIQNIVVVLHYFVVIRNLFVVVLWFLVLAMVPIVSLCDGSFASLWSCLVSVVILCQFNNFVSICSYFVHLCSCYASLDGCHASLCSCFMFLCVLLCLFVVLLYIFVVVNLFVAILCVHVKDMHLWHRTACLKNRIIGLWFLLFCNCLSLTMEQTLFYTVVLNCHFDCRIILMVFIIWFKEKKQTSRI